VSSKRVVLVLLTALVALRAAGCGGEAGAGGGEPPAGAEITPADVAGFGSFNTAFESDQWDAARALAAKFPSSGRVVDEIIAGLREEGLDFDTDVRPALGPEVDVAVLNIPVDGGNPLVVGMTQPEDEARLRELFRREDDEMIVETYREWVIFSDSQEALDQFKAMTGGPLSESAEFGEAMDALDADALARVWVGGEPLREALAQAGAEAGSLENAVGGGTISWLGGQAFATDDGVRVDIATRAEQTEEQEAATPEPYSSELVSEIPADALVFVSFNDIATALQQVRNTFGNANPELDRQIAQLESALGVSLDEDVLPLFEGEGAIWVGPGVPIPVVGVVLSVEDEEQAQQTLDKLGQAAAQAVGGTAPTDVEIAGEAAKELSLDEVSVFWAVFDGKAVISLGRQGIASLKEGGDGLDSNEVYESAVSGADMPDETSGFVFVNLQEGVPLLLDLVQLAGEQVDPEVRSNLEPLRSVLLWASTDDGLSEVRSFVGVQ
jgi:hypothetical protein